MSKESEVRSRKPRADSLRNRDLLLAAGKAAFTEAGADAPLEDIARRAGVGIGTLYRHFPTRDALVAAVYAREVEQLTASAEARAARRSSELNGVQSVADTQAALVKRDAADSGRKTSPLAKAADAVEVDTTDLTLDQVIECIVTLVEEKRAPR